MGKGLRIIVNILILLVVAGFVWYMIASLSKNETSYTGTETEQQSNDVFVSPYTKEVSFDIPKNISALELADDKIYVATESSVMIFDLSGELLTKFERTADIRDIAVRDNFIYLLFPTSIRVYSSEGSEVNSWEACSDNSNYCSLTVTSGYVFVTDAENKNICKYTTDGNFVAFINSPRGFVIPSFSFDIDNWNDTIYCANSGRQQIETYTLNGDFIASFGHPGGQPGAFAGCCNPAYISFTSDGDILTSEKGNPRICLFEKNGKFKELLLNSKMLGGGNKAYDVKIYNDKLYIAQDKTVYIFKIDNYAID